MTIQHGELNVGLQCNAPALRILVHQSLHGKKQTTDTTSMADMQGIYSSATATAGQTTEHISTRFDLDNHGPQRMEPSELSVNIGLKFTYKHIAQATSKSSGQSVMKLKGHFTQILKTNSAAPLEGSSGYIYLSFCFIKTLTLKVPLHFLSKPILQVVLGPDLITEV